MVFRRWIYWAEKYVPTRARFLNTYAEEIRNSLHAENEFTKPVLASLSQLEELTQKLINDAAADPNIINSSCVEYLHAFGYLSYAWVWALMAQKATEQLESGGSEDAFYQAKIVTARYYFKRLLPRFNALIESAGSGSEALFELEDNDF